MHGGRPGGGPGSGPGGPGMRRSVLAHPHKPRSWSDWFKGGSGDADKGGSGAPAGNDAPAGDHTHMLNRRSKWGPGSGSEHASSGDADPADEHRPHRRGVENGGPAWSNIVESLAWSVHEEKRSA